MLKKLTTVLFFVLAVMSLNVQALTDSQIDTLSSAIYAETDQELVGYRATGNVQSIISWLNSTGTFVVWVTNLKQDDIMQSPSFDWARVDNLTNGKARIWDWMFDNSATSINCANANIRTGIDAVWVGTAADLAVRASVIAKCKRFSRRVERYFATGTGSNASPGVLSYEGGVSQNDVVRALFNDDGTPRG
jgi:hypothetical protein